MPKKVPAQASSVRVGYIEEKYRSSMNNMKGVASALLFTAVALAEMPAYSGIEGEMMAMLNGGDRHPVPRGGRIANYARGGILHALTGFPVDKLTDRSVPGVFDSNSTQGIVNSTRTQFSGTSEFLIPPGMDLHQSHSTFGAASGFRLLSW